MITGKGVEWCGFRTRIRGPEPGAAVLSLSDSRGTLVAKDPASFSPVDMEYEFAIQPKRKELSTFGDRATSSSSTATARDCGKLSRSTT